MERQVSFDVTDYNLEGDKWSTDVVNHNKSMSGPWSPNREMKYHEDATEEYVFLTLDIYGDSASVVSVKPVVDGALSVHGNAEPFKSAVNPEKKSLANEPQRRMFKASEALTGLNIFISMTDAGWIAVEKRFHKLRAKTNGFLVRSKFSECIGIKSKEFALELFDMLARQSRIIGEAINLTALRKFWCQTTDQRLNSRLKMFFEMADKDGDGRLTEDELREFIRLTASANNQPITQKLANEYTALIMEELDPDDLGYIIMDHLELLLLDVETLCELTRTEETKKPSKRWCSVVGEISSSCLIPCLKKRGSTKQT